MFAKFNSPNLNFSDQYVLCINFVPNYAERHYIFDHTTRFVFLSVCVCLCVCHQDCDEMAAHSNTVLREAIRLDNSSILQQYQDDPPADPDHMDHLYKITFWPIT